MKRGTLLISAFLLLLQSRGCAPVTVSSSKPRVEIREHEDAVLSCEFKTEKDDHPRIEWKKKGKDISYIYLDGEFKGSFAGRAKIEGATVTLYKATQKDTGEYRCEVTARHDSVKLGETYVTLKVLVPPHTPSCEIPTSALTGLWWRCADTHSGTLHFRTVSRADSGQYRCEASNGVGAPKSCEGKHLKIDDMNMTLILAAGGGGLFLLSVCFLGICCACWRCCRKSKKGSKASPYNRSDSPLPNPRNYKHTQSFML
ncbi:hypothetical protein AGOR_G00217430 [Albula goreensis]|uniref:Ig-like domain-containing protein n=1 Tax=Albula goreensis TaxID=1534307 RepID=A0A8T3CMX1_9TELE|nr:hypothetical protein AGOR_G00217430 [Albula goreensis]